MGFSSTGNCGDFVKRMQDAGALTVTINGKTREQYYSGKAVLEPIKRAVEAVDIPVIANGDIRDRQSALHALE